METITARKQLNGLTRVDMEEYFDDVEVDSLYQWIDRIPLSRPKKNITKDFADAVLAAEIVKHYFPRMVEIHNYAPASGTKQRLENWYLLNRRVLKKLDLELSDDVLRALANCKAKVIERVLMLLRIQIDKFLEKSDTPPGIKSPRMDLSQRSSSPNRLTKSEPASSPRKYNKGEVPHGHPDRTSYFADKPLSIMPKAFLPPVTDNVARVLYDEKDMECQAKEETIQILNAKIRRLEHLAHLKDVRLDELQTELRHGFGYHYSFRGLRR